MEDIFGKNDIEKDRFCDYTPRFLGSMQQSLLTLTRMADQKGSVLLSFNFLVISFIVTQMVLHGLRMDLLGILFFSLTIVLLAIRVLSPRFISRENVNQNFLFFEVIAHMEERAYIEQVFDHLSSDEKIYIAMIKNHYQISLVVQRKYKYLRWAYRVCFIECALGMVILLFVSAKHLGML